MLEAPSRYSRTAHENSCSGISKSVLSRARMSWVTSPNSILFRSSSGTENASQRAVNALRNSRTSGSTSSSALIGRWFVVLGLRNSTSGASRRVSVTSGILGQLAPASTHPTVAIIATQIRMSKHNTATVKLSQSRSIDVVGMGRNVIDARGRLSLLVTVR